MQVYSIEGLIHCVNLLFFVIICLCSNIVAEVFDGSICFLSVVSHKIEIWHLFSLYDPFASSEFLLSLWF